MQTFKESDFLGKDRSKHQLASRSLFHRWINYLQERIDGSSLAVFRMCFAIAVLVNTWLYAGETDSQFLLPKLNFPILPGLHPLSGEGMFLVHSITAFSAACVALGLWYRVSTIVLFITFTYTFLLDATYYQNHHYLCCLLAFLFCLLPADNVWSFDKPTASQQSSIPRWALLTLKAQIVIVFFFGGIAKVNYDWLVRKQPITAYLNQAATNDPFLGQLYTQPWFPQLIAYGGMAFDLGIGFLLSWRPTFWLGTAMCIIFNLTNSQLFHIGVFPYLMLATIGLFAPPNWPKQVFKKLKSLLGKNDESPTDSSPLDGGAPERHNRRFDLATIALLHVYFVLQMIVPLRQFFLYPGENQSWTENTHMFSWGMMLRQKLVKSFSIEVLDPRNGKPMLVKNLDTSINSAQGRDLVTHPGMIMQFVQYLAEQQQRETGIRPIIHIKDILSLNLRPYQDFIDPKVDLAAQPAYGPKPWIVPLEKLPGEW